VPGAMLLGWDSDPGIGRDQPVQFGILGCYSPLSFFPSTKLPRGNFSCLSPEGNQVFVHSTH